MNDWNEQRKARGRIRRARLRRKRQRITIASVLILFCLSVLAIGTVNYGQNKAKQIEIATYNNRSFSMPRMSPMLAQAQTPISSDLPDLIQIEERFPDYREGLDRDEPEEPGEETAPTNESPAQEMVILDDLRAAPPKSMFIKAIFENSEDNFQQVKPRLWLARDFTDDYPDLLGRPQPKRPQAPPIPEPGTGLLLGLGLTGIGSLRRIEQRRRRGRTGFDAAPEASASQGRHS